MNAGVRGSEDVCFYMLMMWCRGGVSRRNMPGIVQSGVSRESLSEEFSFRDRLLGTVFGFARGVILILVFVFVLRQLVPPRDLQWLHHSQLMPHLDMLAQWAQSLFAQFNTGQLPGTTT